MDESSFFSNNFFENEKIGSGGEGNCGNKNVLQIRMADSFYFTFVCKKTYIELNSYYQQVIFFG